MTDDSDRKRIIDRANRLVRQSKTLRKISDELLSESRDLKAAATKDPSVKRRRRKRN